MPVGRPTPLAIRYSCQIITSDPVTGVVEGMLKGDLRRISVITTPVAFRWPVAGENWVVRQENGTWYLDSPFPQTSAPVTINGVAAGDLILNSSTGVIHVLGSSSGATDFTLASSPLSAAAPTSPIDGQQWFYHPDTTGVVWHFRYNAGSSSAHKWEFVGGSPISSEVITTEATASATYTNLTTIGPSLAAPFAGDYFVQFGASIEAALAAGWRGRASVDGTDANAVAAAGGNSASVSYGGSAARTCVLSRTASQATTMTYRSDSANSVNFYNRWIRITPIRVG